eukprot:10829443-Lingulodinium_polyedra.AAC.1
MLPASSTARTLDWHCSQGSPTPSAIGHERQHVTTCSCFTRGTLSYCSRLAGGPQTDASWP